MIEFEDKNLEELIQLRSIVNAKIEKLHKPTPCNTISPCVHKDIDGYISGFYDMEVTMMISTFNHLKKAVVERLQDETKSNESNFIQLKEKQSLIDDTIKKLSV